MKFERLRPASSCPTSSFPPPQAPWRGQPVPRWKKLLGMPPETLLMSLETGKTYRVGNLRASFDPVIANRVDWFDWVEEGRPVERVWIRFLRVVVPAGPGTEETA